jgi:hypothetical protein
MAQQPGAEAKRYARHDRFTANELNDRPRPMLRGSHVTRCCC